MSKMKVKGLCLLLAFMMLATVFAGCGSKDEKNTSKDNNTVSTTAAEAQSSTTAVQNEADKYPLPEVLEWVGGNWGWADPIPEKDSVVKEISKKFGSQIKYTTVKVGSYDDLIKKMQMWASTGMADWPEIFYSGADNQAKDIINRLGREGKLIDWMPYVKQMPEVEELSKLLFPSAITPDGHLYGFPAQYTDIRVSTSHEGIYMRRDWIEQLGISWPKTIPEFEQALIKIRDEIKTVDGTPVIPLVLFGETFTNMLRYFYPNYRNGWYWDKDKQEAINTDMEDTQYLIKGLEWHNKIYNEGLIPTDAFTLKQGQIDEMASQGRVGAIWGADWIVGPYVTAMSQQDPNKRFNLTPPLYEPSVNSEPAKPMTAATPYVLFTIKADTPKEKIYGFLKYVAWSASEEGTLIINYGVPGVHWEYDADGKLVDTKDCAERLKGDWTLRAEEGIGIYGVAFDYGVLARVNANLDINSPNIPKYMKESYQNQGYMTIQGYYTDPNFYITAGKEEMKRTIGASDRYKEMVIKAVTGDPKDIPDIVKKWHDAEYNMGYEIIKKERTEACKQLDMSFLPQ